MKRRSYIGAAAMTGLLLVQVVVIATGGGDAVTYALAVLGAIGALAFLVNGRRLD